MSWPTNEPGRREGNHWWNDVQYALPDGMVTDWYCIVREAKYGPAMAEFKPGHDGLGARGHDDVGRPSRGQGRATIRWSGAYPFLTHHRIGGENDDAADCNRCMNADDQAGHLSRA